MENLHIGSTGEGGVFYGEKRVEALYTKWCQLLLVVKGGWGGGLECMQ